MPVTQRHVVKVGGSLLARRETPARLRQWLADEFGGAQVNMVFGGGKVIDALRDLDAVHAFSPVEIHWCCIRALRVTFEIGCQWFPTATPIVTQEAFQEHGRNRSPGLFLIAVDTFYSPCDGDVLPQDWSTTSDSIAALLAKKLSIDRLTLVKSCQIPPQCSLERAWQEGMVDRFFLSASQGLQVELRNIDG
ncbi:MAG: hypothetical protein ACO1RT_18405 [Planctomycetaceae bacterium]